MQKKILKTFIDWKNSGYRININGASLIYYGYGWYVVRIDTLNALESIIHHYKVSWQTQPQFSDYNLFHVWRKKCTLYLAWDLSFIKEDPDFEGDFIAQAPQNSTNPHDLIRIDVMGPGRARIFTRNGQMLQQWPAMRTFSKHLLYYPV